MSNNKRIRRYVGRPALLDDVERVYRFVWLQPISESQVPFRAKVYDNEQMGAFMGYRADDPVQLEITWLKSLWKEVPDPFADPLPPPLPPESAESLQAVSDSDDEETLEVPTS